MLQALASLTGLAVNDQLLIFGGQRLEPSKTLASRDLPRAAGTPPAPPANAPDANAATRDVKPRHVFLYSKALLRPDAPLPPSEPLESVVAEPAPPAPRGDGTHPLESASSPLVRALPDYERQFRHHRQRVASTWRATQSRFDACKRLVTEMHVQALAIEGARDNVDAHYSYISRTRDEFARAHAAQTASHEELLASFESDMDALRATPLHPAVVAASERRRAAAAAATRDARRRAKRFAAAAASGSGSSSGEHSGSGASTPRDAEHPRERGTGLPPEGKEEEDGREEADGGSGTTASGMTDPSSASSLAASSASSASSSSSPPSAVEKLPPLRRTLLDCVPEDKVRRWAADCRRSHEHFASKVRDLEELFSRLRLDVEALFMTGPDVDIAALEEELERAQTRLGEQASAIQRLDADLEAVRALVEDTVAELSEGGSESGSGSGLGTVLDKCAALHAVDDEHVKSILPAADAADTAMAALHEHCARCKDAMTACVHRQLQSISALQSKIRDMRNKQAAFGEIGQRQEAAFRELRVARRVPRAYRACLAEVARRAADAKVFGAQARQLAERMARGRAKEATRREAFARTHERYLPQDVASALGLGAHPPRCEVTVVGNGADEFPLVKVTDDDLRRAGAETRAAFGAGATGTGDGGVNGGGGIGDASRSSSERGTPTGASPPASSPIAALAAAAAADLLAALDVPANDDDDDVGEDADATGRGGVSLGDEPANRGGGTSPVDLELENARLRADLAAHVAALAAVDPSRVASASAVSDAANSNDSAALSAAKSALSAREKEATRLRAERETLVAAVAALERKIQTFSGGMPEREPEQSDAR